MTEHPHILFMKVGFHGSESLNEIIRRKQLEEQEAGFCFWGYGGTLCHPLKSVGPFLAAHPNAIIKVLFSVTPSPFISDPVLAQTYSCDGKTWQSIPTGITVTSSRYALALRNLHEVSDSVPLGKYVVGFGPSAGMPLNRYIRGRVDKALGSLALPDSTDTVAIRFEADLVSPYSVLLA